MKPNPNHPMLRLLLALLLLAAFRLPAQAQGNFTTGLVAYYPFTGNADSAVAGVNNGVVNGAVLASDRHGSPNAAYFFDGVDDFITIGKNDAVFPNTTLTWSLWFKQSGNTATPILLWDDDRQLGGDRFIHLGGNAAPGDLTAYMDPNDPSRLDNFVTATNVVSGAQWHHVVFAADSSGRKLYLNGVLVASLSTALGDHQGRSYLSIGSGHDGYIGYFHGLIDDIRIYNRALSAADVAALYASEAPAASVSRPPSILNQPQNQTVAVGQTASFSVTAPGALTYQWRKGGAPLAGATNAFLTLSNVQLADAGGYDVTVGNSAGTTNSSVATLTVVPLMITQPPSSLSVPTGGNATFSVVASGVGPFTYQWRFNGGNLPGATAATLTLTNVQVANGGGYSVVVGNAFGTVPSAAGTLNILTPPVITAQPTGVTAVAGEVVTFSISVSGSGPFAYQWRRDGANLPGATARTFSLPSAQATDAGLYSVIVSNAAGVAVSSNATLTVSSAPVIITSPAARVVNASASVSFTVAALGDAPFTYQWRLNGANLAGATSVSYSIAAATPSHEGLYSVVVGNALGSTPSSAARLTVLPVSVVVPWVVAGGGGGSDVGHAIAVDAAGNSYVAGYFNGTATFGTNTLVSAGNTDIFITKQDSNGQLLWARRAGGPGYDAAKGIAVDAQGNCYVTGGYEGVASFGGGTSLTNSSPTSYADVFLAKFDAAGNLVWARSAGVLQAVDEGTGVAVDGAGNVLVTGRSVLDTFAGAPVPNVGRIFVAKYTGAGAEVWMRKAGSYSGGNQDTGTGIATDSAGNVFVGGVFYSPVAAFGASTFTGLGNSDVFLAKFDAAGTLQWARQAGGTGEDTASGVAVAADGSAYLVGALGGNANFSGSNVTSLAGATSDGFVAKFAPGGTVTWVRQMGGGGLSAARAVAVDAAGAVHVTGYFSGGVTFGTNTLSGISGSYDAFLTRLDPSGVFAFAQQAGGADLSGDFGLGVGADAAGNSFITGYFSGTSSIGGGSLPSRGGEDVLVTRFNQFTGGGQPQLGLLRNGPQFRMRWPLASSSYILQSTTNLLAPVWRDEANALTLNGTELETDVTPGSAVKFYRLRKP